MRDPAVTAKIVKSRVLAGGRLSFGKWIFPVIANMAENDVIDQLVLLQPMATPASQVYYMDASFAGVNVTEYCCRSDVVNDRGTTVLDALNQWRQHVCP